MDPKIASAIKLANLRIALQILNTLISDILPVIDEEYVNDSIPSTAVKTSTILYNRLKLMNVYITESMDVYLSEQLRLLEDPSNESRRDQTEL